MLTVGHQREKEFLKKAHTSGRIPNAFAFIGKEGIGKKLLAIEFARGLLCEKNTPFGCGECKNCKKINRFIEALQKGEEDIYAYYSQEEGKKSFAFLIGEHPDLLLLKPDGNQIKIDQIRELQEYIALKPSARYKVVIIDNFSSANLQAQNALLKTLEEPPQGVVFILIATKRGEVLPTILSRCQVLEFKPLKGEQIEKLLSGKDIPPLLKELAREEGSLSVLNLPYERLQELFKFFENLENSGYGDIIKLAENFEGLTKEERETFLEITETLLFKRVRENQLTPQKFSELSALIGEIKRGLKRGVKGKLALLVLLLSSLEEKIREKTKNGRGKNKLIFP